MFQFASDVSNLSETDKSFTSFFFLQVTMGFAEDMDMKRPEDLDLQILKNVRATAGRSKRMMGELKNLKSKMYGIENDLKHL